MFMIKRQDTKYQFLVSLAKIFQQITHIFRKQFFYFIFYFQQQFPDNSNISKLSKFHFQNPNSLIINTKKSFQKPQNIQKPPKPLKSQKKPFHKPQKPYQHQKFNKSIMPKIQKPNTQAQKSQKPKNPIIPKIPFKKPFYLTPKT